MTGIGAPQVLTHTEDTEISEDQEAQEIINQLQEQVAQTAREDISDMKPFLDIACKNLYLAKVLNSWDAEINFLWENIHISTISLFKQGLDPEEIEEKQSQITSARISYDNNPHFLKVDFLSKDWEVVTSSSLDLEDSGKIIFQLNRKTMRK